MMFSKYKAKHIQNIIKINCIKTLKLLMSCRRTQVKSATNFANIIIINKLIGKCVIEKKALLVPDL